MTTLAAGASITLPIPAGSTFTSAIGGPAIASLGPGASANDRYFLGGSPVVLGPWPVAQTLYVSSLGTQSIDYTVSNSPVSVNSTAYDTPGYRVGLIGTSLQQQNDAGNANSLRAFSRGWWTWFQTLYGEYLTPVWHDPSIQAGFEPDNVPGTTRFFRGYNAGVFGSTIDQALARANFFDTAKMDEIIIDAPTNDVFNNVLSQADINSKFEQLVDYFLMRGRHVTVLPILTRSSLNSTTSSKNRMAHVNNFMRDMVERKRNLDFFDWNEPMVDFTNALGNARAGYVNADGVHLAPQGGYAIGKLYAARKIGRYPTPRRRVWIPADVYDLTENPRGNFLPNPLMTGTAGAVGTGVTGTVADSYTAERQTGTSTAVASKEVRADGFGNYQVLTVTPSGTPGTDQFNLRTTTTSITHTYPAGTWISGSIEVDLSAWDGWIGVSPYILDNGTGGISTQGMYFDSALPWTTEAWKGRIFLHPMQVTAVSVNTLRWRTEIRTKGDATGPGVLKMGALDIRACADPRTGITAGA